MADIFPMDARVELAFDEWTDVTPYVRAQDPISITRGRSGEASDTDPAECRLTLDNRDGRFSLRNPSSPYHQYLRRNVPVRVSLPAKTGMVTNYNNPLLPKLGQAYTPDHAKFTPSEELDVRIDIDADQWAAGHLLGKFWATEGHREWVLYIEQEWLFLLWWGNGQDASPLYAAAGPFDEPYAPARRAVRAVLKTGNGVDPYEVEFYTADTIDGPWTLWATETGAGPTELPTEVGGYFEIGKITDLALDALPGRVFKAEIRVDGNLVADPDFSAQEPGTREFFDDQGNLWTLEPDVEITDRDIRFYGEVSTWPQSRDPGGVDDTISISAYGIRRRLEQRTPPRDSVMVREFASPSRQNIVAYWPMEAERGAKLLPSAFSGHPPMVVDGPVGVGEYTDWPSSKPLPLMNSGKLTAKVPAYDYSGGELAVRVFLDVNELPEAATTGLLQVRTSWASWLVDLSGLADGWGGGLRVRAWTLDGEWELYNSGFWYFPANPATGISAYGFVSLAFELRDVAGGVEYRLRVIDFQSDQTWDQPIPLIFDLQNTVSSVGNVGRATSIAVARNYGLKNVAVGHLAIANAWDAFANTGGALNAWNGETAEERFARLSAEDGIPIRVILPSNSAGYEQAHKLGDQTAETLMELLDEAERSDMGILRESRRELGFEYRTRYSLVNQPPKLTLDYNSGQVAGDLHPVDDDQQLVNDVTVKMIGGGSLRLTDEESPVSVLPPPLGVGRYPDEVEISAQSDYHLPAQAGFRLRLGTVDRARYPVLRVELHSPHISDELAERVRRLDIGDRLDILHADEWTERTPMIITGIREDLQVITHTFEFNLVPADPWFAAVVDDDEARYDTAGSELGSPPAPEAEAPDVVDHAELYMNATSVDVPAVGGDWNIAFLTWNTTATVTVPSGWTEIERVTASSSVFAAFIAEAGTTTRTFTFSETSKCSTVVVGVTDSEVIASAAALDPDSDAVREAPGLEVADGPALLLRGFFEKSSTNTSWTPTDGSVVGEQFGTGGGATSLLVTAQDVVAGSVPSATATAGTSSGQGGGISIALYAEPPGASEVYGPEDTSLSVVTTLGPRWTTNPDDLPLDIDVAGERMRVTAISGTGTTQTFTVERSVNGVVKSHPVGVPVQLADPSYTIL